MEITEISLTAKAAMPLLKAEEGSLEQLKQVAERGELFAVIDASDEDQVPAKMWELGENQALSLFEGSARQNYWAIAPYLVAVDLQVLDWIVETLSNRCSTIFACSKEPFSQLQQHFRLLLEVTLPDERRWFFRYYDPRVLDIFLQNCSAQQADRLYGPIDAFFFWRWPSGCLQVIPRLQLSGRDLYEDLSQASGLEITQQQLTVLNEAHKKQFVNYVATTLRRDLPNSTNTVSDVALKQKITETIETGRRHGIQLWYDVERFVNLVFTISPNCAPDAFPVWLQSILSDSALASEDKLDLIEGCWSLICNKIPGSSDIAG